MTGVDDGGGPAACTAAPACHDCACCCRLVSDDILNMVGAQARMVYVGKHAGFHTRTQASCHRALRSLPSVNQLQCALPPQDEIHALLLAFAEAGATVIRLKGGDPYIFGRGGEEVQFLEARGITVHCVPGITAASGACSMPATCASAALAHVCVWWHGGTWLCMQASAPS